MHFADVEKVELLGRYYVQHYNYCYRRTGTLWEGRYKAMLVDSEDYLLTCMRYIELNAVRAGMVAHPSEYPWSSYRCNAQGEGDALVKPHAEFRRLGKTDEARRAAYRLLFRQRIAESHLEEIRAATQKAWVLGSDHFKPRVQKQLERRVESSPRGGDRRSEKFRIGQL